MLGDLNAEVVVRLGHPAVLQCYAYGWPKPYITWWRAERMLPLSSEQYEQRHDHALVIHNVGLRHLGPYTCQAYNGRGKANSWRVTVKAVAQPTSTSPEDIQYHQYLLPPDQVSTSRPGLVFTQAPPHAGPPVTDEPRTFVGECRWQRRGTSGEPSRFACIANSLGKYADGDGCCLGRKLVQLTLIILRMSSLVWAREINSPKNDHWE